MFSPIRHSPSIFLKNKPIHLTFFLTKRCNARCPFCFYLKNNNSQNTPTEELSFEEIVNISNSLNNLLWLAFSGGEIYLRKDLVEISELFYKQNKPVFMLYPTNGLMPNLIKERTEQILKRCKNSVIVVKLSIDELFEAHDKLRDTPGSFDKTLKTYQLLSELSGKYDNFELGVNTVFCANNQHNMHKIIDYVSELKHIKTHTISLVRGNLTHQEFKDIDLNKYDEAISYLADNIKHKQQNIYQFKGARLKSAQDIIQRRLIHQTMQEKTRLIPCYAGTTNLVISETGDVFPCEIRNDSIGNVRDYGYDIQRLLKNDQTNSIKRSIKNNECYCTHECNMMTNILLNPRMYPDLIQEYLQIKTA